MPYSVKITDADKNVLQADGKLYIEFDANIMNDKGKVVEVRRFGYPADTDPDTILEEMAKVAAAYESDLQNAERNKERDNLEKQADETISALTDEIISAPKSAPKQATKNGKARIKSRR